MIEVFSFPYGHQIAIAVSGVRPDLLTPLAIASARAENHRLARSRTATQP